MIDSIEILVSIDAEDVNIVAEIMEEIDELNDLIPDWNKIDSKKMNDRIYELLTRKFLKTSEIKGD